MFRIRSKFLELGVRFKNWECVYKFGVSFRIRSALVGHRTIAVFVRVPESPEDTNAVFL